MVIGQFKAIYKLLKDAGGNCNNAIEYSMFRYGQKLDFIIEYFSMTRYIG